MIRLGLITRIAALVVGVEVATFGALGWFYYDRFGSAADQNLRLRLQALGSMLASEDLAVSAVSGRTLLSGLIGAPCQDALVVGGSGRVIVATDSRVLGQAAAQVAHSTPRASSRSTSPSTSPPRRSSTTARAPGPSCATSRCWA